jgi:diguanylate cyclase (GGDEF)-like protein
MQAEDRMVREQPEPEQLDAHDPDPLSPIGWKSYYAQALEDPRYRMRRVHLRFDDGEMERRFLISYRRSTLGFRRIGVAIGIASFVLFAPIDVFNSPEAWQALWAVRFWLVVPVLLLLLLASYWKRIVPYYGYLVTLGLITSSLALIDMIHLSTRAAMPQHFEALLVLLPSAFGFLRLLVLETTAASAIVILGFATETTLLRPVPPVQLAYTLGFLLAACLVGIVLAYMLERQARLAYVLSARLDEASIRDPLTGLYNRRWLEVSLEQLTSAFQRYGTTFSLILIDLDGFKAVNDKMGYTQGDKLLGRFSEALTKQLRKADIIFRYGGDEFIILAPATGGPAAVTLVDRLRNYIRSLDLSDFGLSQSIGFSVGMAEVDKTDESAGGLFQRANRALRVAKEAGGGLTALDETGKVEPELQPA